MDSPLWLKPFIGAIGFHSDLNLQFEGKTTLQRYQRKLRQPNWFLGVVAERPVDFPGRSESRKQKWKDSNSKSESCPKS